MHPFRLIFLVGAAITSLFLLVRFASTELFLWEAEGHTGIRLLAGPQVCIHLPYIDEHGLHDKCGLFLCADRPPVRCFPAWPLAAVAATVFASATFSLFAPAGSRD
jgi:hypothetical protein